MPTKRNYLLLTILFLWCVSCKSEKKSDSLNVKTVSELKTDSINNYTKSVIQSKEKNNYRNLTIDTTKVFGICAQDPNAFYADFLLTSKSFYVVDYEEMKQCLIFQIKTKSQCFIKILFKKE